ncbi:MAG: hypothetical protein ACHQU8_07770 [Gemmatimonadales bacterium]
MNATAIGTVGVGLLLLAFLLNLVRLLRVDGYPYMLLNLAGAALACWSSVMIRFVPFVVLEGAWAAVAAVMLARRLLSLRPSSQPEPLH